jgi:translocation and assembly module TamA
MSKTGVMRAGYILAIRPSRGAFRTLRAEPKLGGGVLVGGFAAGTAGWWNGVAGASIANMGSRGISGPVDVLKDRIAGALLTAAFAVAPIPLAALESFTFLVPGASDDLGDRLRAASIVAPLADQDVTDPQEVVAAARAEYARLLGALYDQGYYGGVISVTVDGREAADIPPLDTPALVNSVVVEVRPGPRYLFSRATVAPLATGTDLPEGYAAGLPAQTSAIRSAANAAVGGWRSLGYAKAEVSDQDIVADHRARTVASDLRLAPGRQLRYGDIIVQGTRRMNEARVVRMSGLRRADPLFDPEDLRRAANRIRRSGVFSSVSVTEAETPNPDGTIDIIVQVAEERRRRYGLGLEFSTVEGPAIDAFWLHRNLFGGGERLRIDGRWSSIGGDYTGGEDYSLGARFTRTGSFGPDTDFYALAEIEQLNEPNFTSSSASLELGYTRIVSDTIEVAVGLGYGFTSVQQDGATTEFRMLYGPLQATYDTRDDILDARRGIYADVDLTPFLGFRGTDNGLYFYGDGRAYQTFGDTRPITLAGRLQLGSIIGARLDRVPNDMRFYSGGGGTVRGQNYQSLDITLNGRASGGASFVGFSGEVRALVTDTIGVVAFADYGVIGADPFPEDWDNAHSGAGLGLRYQTPVGPLRVDVAVPVTGDTEADDYHLYIGIGQTF